MERILQPDTILHFDKITGTFLIKQMIGRGSSCVTYLSEYSNSEGNRNEYLLKEYNPNHLELFRDDHGYLVPSNKTAFQAGLERFLASADVQEKIRLISGLRNSTAIVHGMFEANGTGYMLMPVFDGDTYENTEDSSPTETYKTVRSLTEVIEKYHDNGYLHLDIKPSNMFVLPQTRELLFLIDFDSVVSKEELNSVKPLSYTQNWAAPEQIILSYRDRICEATDLFSIGEILFFRIMGRHSEANDRRPFSKYIFPNNVELQDQNKLARIFRHTICSNVRRRWQSARDLLDALDDLIAEEVLISTPPSPVEPFVGRSSEMDEIHRRLNENRILFLTGIGGIGKSELAKHYAITHQHEYDTIITATYEGSWLAMIVNDTVVRIKHLERNPNESVQQYLERKISKLKELCNERTLFLLDNVDDSVFEGEENRIWATLLSLNCNFIITSRATDWQYPSLEILPIQEETELLSLFMKWCPFDAGEAEFVRKLIRCFDGHTMAIEMTAKQIYASFSTPRDMAEQLKVNALESTGDEQIKAQKDGTGRIDTAFNHIRALFDISHLSDYEVRILSNLAMLPPDGTAGTRFVQWCKPDSSEVINTINKLVRHGWIRRTGNRISVHPLLGEVIFASNTSVDSAFIRKLRLHLKQTVGAEDPSEREDAVRIVIWCLRQLERHKVESKDVFWLYFSFVRTMQHECSYVLAEHYAKQALYLAGRFYGEKSVQACSANFVLGDFYSETGRYTLAESYYDRANALLDENLVQYKFLKHMRAQYLTKKGYLRRRESQYPLARSYYDQALELLVELHGPTHISTANVYKKLGDICKLTYDYSSAKSYYNKARDIYLMLASSKKKIAQADVSLASVEISLGNLDQAESILKKALAIQQSCLNDDHIDLGATYAGLGSLEIHRGHNSEAIRYYKMALAIDEKHLPDSHPFIATMHYNIANAATMSEMWDAAEDEYNRAIELCGENQKDTLAACYLGIAKIRRHEENWEAAIAYAKRSFDLRCEIFGNEHEATLNTEALLGRFYCAKEDYENAILHLLHVTQSTSPDRCTSCNEQASNFAFLSSACRNVEDYENARVFAEKAVQLYLSLKNTPKGELGFSYHALGEANRLSGRQEQSIAAFEQALSLRLEIYPPDHQKIRLTKYRMALALDELGRTNDALTVLRELLPLIPPDAPDTPTISEVTKQITVILHRLGEHEEACAFEGKSFNSD